MRGPMRPSTADRPGFFRAGWLVRFGGLCLAALAGPAMAQGQNPWTPPGSASAPRYGGTAAGPDGSVWAPQAAPVSRYAPPDLDQQLSSGTSPASPAAPGPTVTPAAPVYPPASLQQPTPTPAAPAPTTVPQAPAQPGLFAPPAPATVPGGYGYGYGYGYPQAVPVVPGVPGYPGALPYGYGATLPYGSTGWPGGYGSGWPGGVGTGWPGYGISPFGFW